MSGPTTTKRLTWLAGPPGAGKSTWAKKMNCAVVEFNDMLEPLIGPRRVRKGVLTANASLVSAVRAVLLHPENAAHGPTLVVVGMVAESALFPLSADEEAWLLLPERDRWERQLLARPTDGGRSNQYDDYDYARSWYERFLTWSGTQAVTVIDSPFRPELLGKVAPL